jgi:elongator complex protein 1
MLKISIVSSESDSPSTPISSFPGHCLTTSHTSHDGQDLFFGVSSTSKLHLASSTNSRTIATNTNSFTIASGFLIFTTTSHEAKFAPLSALADETKWESRRVERGSRIVVAVPSTMSLVLQMPRGNLETIHPRPMVMRVVEEELDKGNYRNAFISCRKHRIDLNVLVTHSQEAFLEHLPQFVEQVHEVDHINLFLTNVGWVKVCLVELVTEIFSCVRRSALPKDVIAKICDAISQELEKKNLTLYVNSILTAHVVKTPPEYEEGLKVLLRLRGGSLQYLRVQCD